MKYRSKSHAYLQLIRVPNGFTAIADSWAGYLIYTGLDGASFVSLFFLAVASFCLYSMGIVLNDLRDQPIDARLAPHRPLPSGAVSRPQVILLALGLSVVAGAGCGMLGWLSFLVGGAVCVSIIMYDIFFKDTIVSPVWMGACRMFNMMLGMSAASVRFYEYPHALTAVYMLVYVTILTIASRCERNRSNGVLIFAGLVVWVLVTCLLNSLLGVVTHVGGFVLLGFWCAIAGLFFLYENQVRAVSAYRMLVVFFIFSIAIVDAMYTAGAQGIHAGLLVLACLIPTVILSFFYSGH